MLILCHLEEYLRARVGATVAQGYNGSEGVPTEETVRIYRSEEREINLWMRGGGEMTFNVDVWHGNDDIDPKVANTLLAELESQVRAALKAWPEQAIKDLKLKLDVPSLSVSGDNENYRPMCAAFYRVMVKWNK